MVSDVGGKSSLVRTKDAWERTFFSKSFPKSAGSRGVLMGMQGQKPEMNYGQITGPILSQHELLEAHKNQNASCLLQCLWIPTAQCSITGTMYVRWVLTATTA